MVFLARLAGALARSVLGEASMDVGDRGRVPVEGVSEEDRRASEVSLRERSARLEDDGSISEVARGEGRGCERSVNM